jgi:hypothetical protein
MGEWENGRMGEWENGRMGEWENGRIRRFAALMGKRIRLFNFVIVNN